MGSEIIKISLMTKANGYIISKEYHKEGDNFEVCMDISSDDKLLAFGYGPTIKLVSINTDSNYWFQDKKIITKYLFACKETGQKNNIPNNQRMVRDLKWNISDNAKNYIGVAMGESAFIYDANDTQGLKAIEGFNKVFNSDDVMRQGDYPSKFVWFPNSKDVFLCTSSKTDEIVMRDLKQKSIVSKFNGTELSLSKSEQKIEDLKFSPVNQSIFATISKNSTVEIFDIRKSNKSISKNQSAIQNYKSNFIDWEWNGQRLVTAFGGRVHLWRFNGENLHQDTSFEHKNAISGLKWLRKHPDYLLVSEMQENIVYGYNIKKEKHDIEILMDPRHSGLKKFITDRNQERVLGLINFEDSKKNHNELMGVFIDYKSSQPIWSKTKFFKPNQMGIDNQLLFSATRIDYNNKNNQISFPLIFKEIQSSARFIEETVSESQIVCWKEKEEDKRKLKNKLKLMLAENRRLRQEVEDKDKKEAGKLKVIDQSEQKQPITPKPKTSNSCSTQKLKKPLQKVKSLQKSNLARPQPQNFSSQSSGSEDQSECCRYPNSWITTYQQQIIYFDQNYLIQFANQSKDENICMHNSRVAERIGKDRCAQFWRYIYYFAFPETEARYNLAALYQDKVKVDLFFRDNKIIANFDTRAQIGKKIEKVNIQKIIQNMVDENQLQTAVIASIMLRNKDPSLVSLEFIEPFLVCYKQLLKALGLTLISTKLSFLAKLNQAVTSALLRFQIPIGCGQCYSKFGDRKCSCLQVCVLCGDPLRARLVVGCKICGHMVHANQVQNWVQVQNKTKCPYEQCKHQCFQI